MRWRRRNLRNRFGFVCTLFLNSDLISLFDQLGRGRAHALGKSNAFFDPDGSLVVLAEIIGKDFGAKRYATDRYDPAVAGGASLFNKADSSLLGLKIPTLFAGTATASPVRGLRACLALVSRILK